MISSSAKLCVVASAACARVNGCGGGHGAGMTVNVKPTFILGTINVSRYDGTADDLATGGLGKVGSGGRLAHGCRSAQSHRGGAAPDHRSTTITGP